MKLRLPLPLVSALMSAFVAFSLTQTVSAGESICINFGSIAMPDSDALAGADGIGVASKNWNNALSNTGTMDLINSNNVASGVSITWKGGATGTAATGGAGKEMAEGNKQMMGSYLDDKNGEGSSFSITNINYLTYDVYIYCAFNNGQRFEAKEVNGVDYTGNGTSTIEGGGVWGYSETGAVNGELKEGGNYLRIPMLGTGSGDSLDILGNVANSQWTKGGVSGIMIVNTSGTALFTELSGDAPVEWTSATWKDSAGNTTAWADTAGDVETSARFKVTGDVGANVTISGSVTMNTLVLSAGELSIKGGALNMVNSGMIQVEENSALSISSTLTSGKGSITKRGAGLLTLSGDALKYSGNLSIQEGTLIASKGLIVQGASTTVDVAGELRVENGNLDVEKSNSAKINIAQAGKITVTENLRMNYRV